MLANPRKMRIGVHCHLLCTPLPLKYMYRIPHLQVGATQFAIYHSVVVKEYDGSNKATDD